MSWSMCFVPIIYTYLKHVEPFHTCRTNTPRLWHVTSSNRNIFRVTGPLCGEFTGPGEFPTQWSVTWSFDVFFDLRLNKRLSKQPWSWWFGTPSWSLWRQCNDEPTLGCGRFVSFTFLLCLLISQWLRAILYIQYHVLEQNLYNSTHTKTLVLHLISKKLSGLEKNMKNLPALLYCLSFWKTEGIMVWRTLHWRHVEHHSSQITGNWSVCSTVCLV